MEYAKLASGFSKGIIDYDNHFTYRLPVIVFTGLSYLLFGVSDFSSSLPPLIATSGILLLVFLELRNKSNLTLTLGLSMTLLSNWFIFYSDKIMPDIYVALFVLLSLYCLGKYKYNNGQQKNTALFAGLFSTSLFMAFLSKETILLIFPLVLYLAILDLVRKKNILFWLSSIVTGVGLLTVYFIGIKILTGDFGKRFEAITNNSYLNLCSYDKQPINILLKRIGYEFFELFINQSMFTGFIFLIAALFQKNIKRIFFMEDAFAFYLASGVILVLSSNFMTVSPTSYSPMCLDARHYLFLIPILSIPASVVITEYIESKRRMLPIINILITTAFISYFADTNCFGKLYLPLSILFIATVFIKDLKTRKIIFCIGFVIISSLIPYEMVKYATKVNYDEQKEIVERYILKENDSYIITDPVQKRIAEYLSRFDISKGSKILNFNDIAPTSKLKGEAIIFSNWYTQYLSSIDQNDLPSYLKSIDSDNSLFYENKDLHISIYRVKEVGDITGTEILNSYNDFEHDMHFWNSNGKNTSHETKLEGNSSWVLGEYSSTFVYPLDSMIEHNFNALLFSSKVYCNFDNKTASSLIVSIENPEGQYFWKSTDINKHIIAYSNWSLVKLDVKIDKKELKKNSILKIYIWNPKKEKGYIDNFNVKIIGLMSDNRE